MKAIRQIHTAWARCYEVPDDSALSLTSISMLFLQAFSNASTHLALAGMQHDLRSVRS